MTPLQHKIAQRREHMILAAGLSIEIAMALGDRAGAERHKVEMYALIAAREAAIQQAEEEGVCYFVAAGEVAALQAGARNTKPGTL